MSDTQIVDLWLPVARLEISGAASPLHSRWARGYIYSLPVLRSTLISQG